LDFYCNKLGLVEVNRYDSEAGRFTLVFLAAPDDAERAREGHSPLLEITWNWDSESYDGGRNFGHLAYRVDNIYALCQQLMDKRGSLSTALHGMATWLSFAHRMGSLSNCCRRGKHCHRRNPGHRWKIPAAGKRPTAA
jgi:catechol 2,3-dioxygenase-like lactoylglutathione lyase family enzyme